MSVIRNTNNIPITAQIQSLDAYNKSEALEQEKLKQSNKVENMQQEQLDDENMSYFNKQESREYDDNQDLRESRSNIFSLPKDSRIDENIAKAREFLNLEENKTNTAENKLQTLLNKHLTDLDFSILWEIVPESNNLKTELDKLLTDISECPEGMEMTLLEETFSKYQGKAQIYMAIMYLLEELKIRKLKKKFQEDLIIDAEKYAMQESAFLFEFFDIQKNQNIKNLIGAKAMENIAKLNSGEVLISDLKQAAEYIRDNFNGEFANIVSIYIKLRAKQLITLCNLNRESRNQLAELFRIEKNFILVHTVYQRMKTLYTKMKASGINCSSADTKTVVEFLNFVDLSLITDAMVVNLARGLGIVSIEHQEKTTLLQEIIQLLVLSQIPSELFKGPKEQQRFINGIRVLLSDYKQKSTNDKKDGFLFKKRKLAKIYI